MKNWIKNLFKEKRKPLGYLSTCCNATAYKRVKKGIGFGECSKCGKGF